MKLGEAGLVEKLHAAYQGVRYYKADFEQIKNIKFLSQPIVSKGLLVFSSELGLVWEVHDHSKVITEKVRKK